MKSQEVYLHYKSKNLLPVPTRFKLLLLEKILTIKIALRPFRGWWKKFIVYHGTAGKLNSRRDGFSRDHYYSKQMKGLGKMQLIEKERFQTKINQPL